MNAIQRKAEASVELWHDAQKSLEDDCGLVWLHGSSGR